MRLLLWSALTRRSAILRAAMAGTEPCCRSDGDRLYRGRPLAEYPTSCPRPPELEEVSANVAGTGGKGVSQTGRINSWGSAGGWVNNHMCEVGGVMTQKSVGYCHQGICTLGGS